MNSILGVIVGFFAVVLSVFGFVHINQTVPLATQNQVVQTATGTASRSSAASVAIDQSSLVQEVTEDGSPVITGTASNISEISLYISGFHNLVHQTVSDGSFNIGPVVNGHWSVTLPNSNIDWSPGTYSVELRDMSGNILATDTLKILLPVTVDASSLTAKAGEVTIAGTAPSVSALDVFLLQKGGPAASGTVSVASGRWSFSASLVAGTYNVWILDATKPIQWSANNDSLLEGSLLWYSGYNTMLVVQ